jgi:hypothetical protein
MAIRRVFLYKLLEIENLFFIRYLESFFILFFYLFSLSFSSSVKLSLMRFPYTFYPIRMICKKLLTNAKIGSIIKPRFSTEAYQKS